MKKLVVVFLSLTMILALGACTPDAEKELPEAEIVEDVALSNSSTSYNTDFSTTVTQPKSDMLIDTEYYTISAPSSWNDDCIYEISDGDSYNYSLSFYDKASHEAVYGGWLFSIDLLTEFEDYSNYPDHDVLGSLEVYRIGSYNIVVTYPTDVQCSEETAEKYREMYNDIPDMLKTISFKDECTFSEEPIPVDNGIASQVSLCADFYTELYAYVMSNCVNYTEWWSDPTLSYTDPSHYYLGHITSENYSEKMDKAKQLVDGVYKAGYWEIRYNGYGTIKIGLYITPDDELYFCYK